MNKLSKNFKKKILPLYRWYAERMSEGRFNLDFSDEAILDYYNYETYGIGQSFSLSNELINGCAYAKHWIDAMIKEYKSWMKQGLFEFEEFLADVPQEFQWFYEKNLKQTQEEWIQAHSWYKLVPTVNKKP